MTPAAFAAKWNASTLGERQAAQSHWNDLCRMIGQPTPAEHDAVGAEYCFERGAQKTAGGDGWADVWWKSRFAVEYKGKHKDLAKAYDQLLQYRESLGNPPLLIVTDMQRFEVHTNFTGTAKRVFRFNLDDIAQGGPVACDCNETRPPSHTAIEVLRFAFTDPRALRPALTAEFVTTEASTGFARIAESMRSRGIEPHNAAHFLMKCLFCLFAEDIKLLPEKVFERITRNGKDDTERLARNMSALFGAMKDGGDFGADTIPWFNGGLFDDEPAIKLTETEIKELLAAARLDWSQVEPSIFGTLFERSLDPDQRAQLGAHYTSRDDIMLIVEPVVLRPMLREWEKTRQAATPLIERYRKLEAGLRKLQGKRERAGEERKLKNARQKIEALYAALLEKFHSIAILDPACGSGNFLYVALNELKNVEKQIILEAYNLRVGLSKLNPLVEPSQLFGIEFNPYAHELAQVVVWIGYIQWHIRNGYQVPREPILKPLNNIRHMDALLARSAGVSPAQAGGVPPLAAVQTTVAGKMPATGAAGTAALRPEWPKADYIIGNPPFLGGKLLRTHLGDEYVDRLFKAYDGDVAREADLSVYWHERARALIEAGKVQRTGLLATQGIRGGANQRTLKRILETGNIFEAWSDKKWMLAGAAVHVSIVCQDNGDEKEHRLDGTAVTAISADLSGGTLDLSTAQRLPENTGMSFMGDTKGGRFDIPPDEAQRLLRLPNPHGKPNSDVIVPWVNGADLNRRPRNWWIIDFNEMSLEEAARYEAPFELVREHVLPERQNNKRDVYRERWWLHVEARPAMRNALSGLSRFPATCRVAKHRLFVWLKRPTLPDSAIIVFAREDDYFFGVLHSVAHERWALRLGTQLEDRPRYTPTTCFETFPFPWPPGHEPHPSEREASASALASNDTPGKSEREASASALASGNVQPDKALAYASRSDRSCAAIANAARELNELRENWLNAPGLSEAEARKRTLTNLYNQSPTWLTLAHEKLNKAVFEAYGWHDLNPADITTPQYPGETTEQAKQRQKEAEEEMLKRLLMLNLKRAGDR